MFGMIASKKMKRRERPKGFIFAFFFVAILFLICLFFLPMRYETNDDFGNIRQLTALSGFEPDSFSPVHGQFFGLALCSLYNVAPGIPWYGLTVYTALLLGVFLMTGVLARHGKLTILMVCLPGIGLFFFHAMVLANYTTSALFVELAVFLAWAEWAVTGTCPARRPAAYTLLLAVGFCMSYMLRWELALWGVVFVIPALLFLRKPMMKKVSLVALAVLAVIVADRAVYEYNRPEAAKQYMVYNELRRVFHDTAKGDFYSDRTPGALAKANWDPKDYITYRKWVLYDDVLFNAANLKVFLAENNPQQSTSLLKMIPERLANSFLKSKYYSLVFMCALGAIILLYSLRLLHMNGKDVIRCGTALGFVYATIIFFAYYRFEPRIYLPLFSYALVLTHLVLSSKVPLLASTTPGKRLKDVVFTIAVLLVLASYAICYTQAKGLFRLLDSSQQKKAYVTSCLEKTRERTSLNNPLLVVMDPTNSLATESVHPLKEMADYTPARVMPGGTGVNSPRYTNILQSLGQSNGRDFLQGAIDNDRVLFALMARGSEHHKFFVALWESYYNRNIIPGDPGTGVGFRPVMDFRNRAGAGLILFELVTS